MADNNQMGNPGVEETPPAVDETAELKAFMGEAYKEGMTLKDVSAFLKGKKYADLNGGGYVSKRKYDDLESKHNAYIESTKDYESLKTENASYKEKERLAGLKKQAQDANIDDQFIEYALTKIDADEQDTAKALKEWAKKNPQFCKETQIVRRTPSHEGGTQPRRTLNEIVNANIRKAAGRSQEK